MSCSNQVKPSQEIAIDSNWSIGAKHWRKNSHSTSRDTTKWFCNMTMLGHMLQNMKTYLETLRWEVLLYCHIHQTLPCPIITCNDRWHMARLSSTFILMKKPEDGSIHSYLKRHCFSTVEFKCCKNDGKSSGKQWTILSVICFLLIFENKTLLFMKNQWELIQSPNISVSNNWNHLTVETVAIQVSKQISSDSFKNEITYKLCAQTNDWC